MSNNNNKQELPPPVLHESLQSLAMRGLVNLAPPPTTTNTPPPFSLGGRQAAGPMSREGLVALLDQVLDMLEGELDFDQDLLPLSTNTKNQNQQ